MSGTATQQGPAGSFATSRRGGPTAADIRTAERLRSGDRPWSWQNIARRLGLCETDVRAFFADPEPNDPADNGPKATQWGPAQVAYLRARYTIDGPSAVATALGSTATAVSKKASRLGITQSPGWNGKSQTQALAA